MKIIDRPTSADILKKCHRINRTLPVGISLDLVRDPFTGRIKSPFVVDLVCTMPRVEIDIERDLATATAEQLRSWSQELQRLAAQFD